MPAPRKPRHPGVTARSVTPTTTGAPDAGSATHATEHAREAVLEAARAGRWETAARDGAALLALPAHQHDTALWTALGQALTAQDRLDEALDAFDRARALTPTSNVPARLALLRERRVPLARRRALALLADTDSERAAEGAAEDAPEMVNHLSAQLGLLWELERFPEALAIARHLTESPTANHAEWLARAVLARLALDEPERSAEVRQATERAVAAAPGDESVRLAARASLRPLTPVDALPPWLGDRGFRLARLRGAEVVVPPVCVVTAGPFLMGSDSELDTAADDDELPQHFVDLPAFAISCYHTTVAEYARFVRAGHRAPFHWGVQLMRPDCAVVHVAHADAVAYASWLAEQTGDAWRLPNEAEWEKAARWDDVRRYSHIYPWGDRYEPAFANFAHTALSHRALPLPVGTFAGSTSPCGALDMAGSVWEWTSSRYRPYPYDARGGSERERATADHVVRGGAWAYGSVPARAACRGHCGPLDESDGLGFRLARAVEAV